ncbi:MAG: hypothetical protein HQK51_20060 [Oligoflexia bacterium]|nr:hypothetical protein [Oligoflexia bacterium]
MIYLLYLKLAVEEDNTAVIIRCSQCGILILTKNCNSGRKDICCPFGCRKKRKQENSKARSKKYYDNGGHTKKKILNRARSDKTINKTSALQSQKPQIDPFILYLRILLHSIFKEKISLEEIIHLHQKVISRSLEFCKNLAILARYD